MCLGDRLKLDRKGATGEQLFDTALGAGAEDIADEGDEWVVTAPAETVEDVRVALEAAKIAVRSSGIAMIPKNQVTVGTADAPAVLKLVDTLDEHDDVQAVWAAFELSDEAAAALDADG